MLFTATDNGTPQLSANSTVTITVLPVAQPVFKKVSYAKTVSIRTGGTQTWTAQITDPNTNLALWVNLRIVGRDSTGSIVFTATSGPVQTLAGQTSTLTVSQSFDSTAVGKTITFTAYIDWGLSSTGITQTSTSTKGGSVKVTS